MAASPQSATASSPLAVGSSEPTATAIPVVGYEVVFSYHFGNCWLIVTALSKDPVVEDEETTDAEIER